MCLLFAVVAAACSSGGDVTTTTAPSSSAPEPEQVAAAIVGQIADQGGDGDASLDAVLYAMERGYSAEQLLSIGGGIVLRLDGVIEAGAAVAPEAEPLGLVILPAEGEALRPNAVRAAMYQQSPLPVELLRTSLAEATGADPDSSEAVLVALLVLLAETGYAPGQIVEAIVFGAEADAVEGCPALRVAGELVVPMLDGTRGCPTAIQRAKDEEPPAATTTTLDDSTTTTTVPDQEPDVAALVAVGPIFLPPQDGEVTVNEWRYEACEDGRFFIEGEVVSVDESTVTFATTGEGTWDIATGAGTGAMTLVVTETGGTSDSATTDIEFQVSFDAIVVYQGNEAITLPVIPGEPSLLCS
jgi:hypothetical protein